MFSETAGAGYRQSKSKKGGRFFGGTFRRDKRSCCIHKSNNSIPLEFQIFASLPQIFGTVAHKRDSPFVLGLRRLFSPVTEENRQITDGDKRQRQTDEHEQIQYPVPFFREGNVDRRAVCKEEVRRIFNGEEIPVLIRRDGKRGVDVERAEREQGEQSDRGEIVARAKIDPSSERDIDTEDDQHHVVEEVLIRPRIGERFFHGDAFRENGGESEGERRADRTRRVEEAEDHVAPGFIFRKARVEDEKDEDRAQVQRQLLCFNKRIDLSAARRGDELEGAEGFREFGKNAQST